ncbi:MAG: flavodoxin domain-containing protein, partial [Oscillospiraceae bacterium]|nr:flavodoxin domain-containing protein [Oscillospiraceae bacterium]
YGEKVADGETVIFCSYIHAGFIHRLKIMKSSFPGKLIVAVTGATPAAAENVINKIWAENFTPDELATIPHFYLQSGLNYDKMGFLDRAIMKLVAKMVSGTQGDSEVETGAVQAMAGSHDISSREFITPLVEYVRRKLQ